MPLLIRNGEIVTATERRVADVWCEGERITRIGPGLEAPPDATVIDARGMYVFPGFVDAHVHAHLPLKTVCSKDTYETASRAAVVGGTTCFIDFVSPEKEDDPLDAVERWNAKSEGQSACDYAFHLAVPRFDRRTEPQIREAVREGITSFKVYLAYKGSVDISDEELRGVLRLARETGAVTLGHCEDAEAIDRLQKRLIAEGHTGPEWHYHSRPPFVEAEGTARFARAGREAGVPVYVVHLSCREALAAALAARGEGARAWIETLTSFLLLDRTYAERPGFEGAKYVVSPPLRDKENQDILWEAVADGIIDTVSTDHAPFDFEGQKTLGRGDFTKIPNGMPTLQDRVNLLHTYGVQQGKITLNRLVEAASTKPAKIFGLYPRKGEIAVGSDADLVVFDPNLEATISAKTHLMNVDYNPFEGWAIRGAPRVVAVRGEVAARDGGFAGTMGRGRFLRRESGWDAV